MTFPPQPPGLPWPTGSWPEAVRGDDLPATAAEAVRTLVRRSLAEPEVLGLHLALVVVHRGRIVAESYGPTAGADETFISWSMAKSVVHALVGVCVRDGLLHLDQPAPVVEWQSDRRKAITIQHLLNMRDGLDYVEDYVDARGSDVIEMLFGRGKDDVAGYAAGRPQAHEPGAFWNYSSGTTNLLARIVGDAVGGGEDGMRAFLQRELFGPLGMTSADPRFDAAGTFVGSSFLYATARDFARFGLLYLRGGAWDGQRILPAGWVDHARTSTGNPDGETFGYGAHWWLWREAPGTFGAHGYENQFTIVSPERDVVIVRLGKTTADQRPAFLPLLRDVLLAFPVEHESDPPGTGGS